MFALRNASKYPNKRDILDNMNKKMHILRIPDKSCPSQREQLLTQKFHLNTCRSNSSVTRGGNQIRKRTNNSVSFLPSTKMSIHPKVHTVEESIGGFTANYHHQKRLFSYMQQVSNKIDYKESRSYISRTNSPLMAYKFSFHNDYRNSTNQMGVDIIIKCFTTSSKGYGDNDTKVKQRTYQDKELQDKEGLSSNDHKRKIDKEFVDYLTGTADDVVISSSNPNSSPLSSSLSSPVGTHKSHESSTSNPETAASSAIDSKETSNTNKAQSDNSTTSTKIIDDWFNLLLRSEADLGRTPSSVAELNKKECNNEAYNNIIQTQTINIEKSRKKQLVTVRRALAGNVIIAASKLAAFLHSGSSAMMSEFVHSVVDCGNQSLLLLGLRDSGNVADRRHQYGYGKSIYFWALVSALGTFFLGAGVSMTQAIPELIHGSNLSVITWHVWSVLGFSFVVDGYVFTRTLTEVNDSRPPGISLWKHVWALRDPATLAILLEDGAACLGVLMAIGGLGLTQAFDMPVYDALAGVGISGLLASMGVILVRVNHRFLLGQSVDKDIRIGIEKILMNRKSIDAVHSVQSQWTGPETFSFKAEVDFDGTFLAAKLMPRYQEEFAEARATLDQDLRVLLSWYAEDVMRTVEREVRNIEFEIRKEYPGAQFIELEPMSKDADRFAIDDGLEASLKRIEIESLNRYLKSLYQSDSTKSKPDTSKSSNDKNNSPNSGDS